MKLCNASKQEITNKQGSVQFLCPKCMKGVIVRSVNSRQVMSKYTCPVCGFTGPN